MAFGNLFACFGVRSKQPRRRRRPSKRRSRGRLSQHQLQAAANTTTTATAGLTVRPPLNPTDRTLSLSASAYGSPRSVFSEDDYFDAVEEHALSASSVSSRGSAGRAGAGNRHQDLEGMHPPGDGGVDRDSFDEELEEDQGMLSRLAHWWQDFLDNHSGSDDDDDDQQGAGNASSAGTPASPKSPTSGGGGILPSRFFGIVGSSSHNNNNNHTGTTTITSAGVGGGGGPISGGVIKETDDVSPPVGCIGLLTATQVAIAQKKFLKAAHRSKPRAGSSFKRASEIEDKAPCAWEPADATTFLVRSKEYMKTRVKEPSGPSFYRLLGVDMYSFDTKVDHISQYIDLPQPPTLGPGAASLAADKRITPLLIINLQLPTYAPSVFGGTTDGAGHSLVYYFALPEGWEPEMVGNDAAVEMLQRFMADGVEADGQPTRDRLKLLPRIINVDEWAIEGPLSGPEVRLLRNYNGKPLLTRPQHRFYSDENRTYLEVDLDVHRYAYIARRAFHGYITRLAPVIFENAFCLQGNSIEELPEVVLGAARVFRVDFLKSRPFPAAALERLSANLRVATTNGTNGHGAAENQQEEEA